ncbi:MAG: SPOR domain-containing protein [Nitrospirota bacterium]
MQKRKILVLDDDPSVCNSIKQALQLKGFDVFFEKNPAEGIEKAKDINPDLIFISLLLSESNGLKVSKSIHSTEGLEKVPVILLISYQGELDPRYTATIGIVDVLVKPPKTEDIISKTMNILGEAAGTSVTGITGQEPEPEEEEVFSIEEAGDLDEIEAEFAEDTGEALETLEEEISDLKEDYEIPEPFDDRGEGDSAAEFEPPDTDLKAGGFFDKDIDEEWLEEETKMEDIPDRTGGKEVDEIFEEEKEEQEEDRGKDYLAEGYYIPEAEKKGTSVKKIIAVIGSLVVVAGLGFGAFTLWKMFFADTGKNAIETVLEEASKSKTALPEEKITENMPQPDVKAKEAIPAIPVETAKSGVEQPRDIKKPEPVPAKPETSVPPKDMQKKYYSVQVGAFGSEQNAESLADKLKKNGYDAFIQKDTTSGNRTIYRVLIGKFDERNMASQLAGSILRKEGIRSIVYHN